MEQNREYIKIWLNNNTTLTNGIMSFPETIIEHQGEQIFELVTNLMGGKNSKLTELQPSEPKSTNIITPDII
jgi:hypothetical protein